MKQVEYFNFYLPPDAWNKKPYASRFKMTVEDAAQRHPGAIPIPESREVRDIPETAEEVQAKQSDGPGGSGD